MTPLLVLAFGFHPATAVGTDLLYASATKTVGTGVHGWRGTIDWKLLGRLAIGSVPATALTLFLIDRSGVNDRDTAAVITVTLGAALVLAGVATLFRAWLVAKLARHFEGVSTWRLGAATVLLGAVLGVLVSLSSIGAGAIGATLILLIYPRMRARDIVGTDIAHAVPLTLVAGIGHASLGNVNWELLVSLLIGSLPGIWLGAQLTRRLPDGVVRSLLCASLLMAGWKVIH